MITNEGSTRIVIIITSWARILVLGRSPFGHIVKMHYFFQKILFNLGQRSDNQLCI